MRKLGWIFVGAGSLVIVASAIGFMRSNQEDDFAPYRKFIRGDVTTVYRANPRRGLNATTRYRELYIDSKNSDEAFRIASEIAGKRRWSIWHDYPTKGHLLACDGEMLDPRAQLQVTSDKAFTQGHSAVILDIKQLSGLEIWLLRMKNNGKDPTHPFY